MAPPSFSSFPDLSAKSTSTSKQSTLRASSSSTAATKRPRATDFLDQLGEELGIEGEQEFSLSERKGKGKEREGKRRDGDDRRERKESKRASKDRSGKDEVSSSHESNSGGISVRFVH